MLSPPPPISIDEEAIRQDINNDNIKNLYKLIKDDKSRTYENLNYEMDKGDKEEFFNILRNYYYPDGFFSTERVARKGFTEDEIRELTNLLRPFSGKLSRKRKPKAGGKKRRYTKRKPTKRRRPTKRRATKRRATKRRR
tara:strand:+ start:106 stop:522 length:417 start_codon:yes stop_codon:yes gene_type:complete